MSDALSPEDVQTRLLDVSNWFADELSSQIARTVEFENFEQALSFVNQVGEIAEQENHHNWGLDMRSQAFQSRHTRAVPSGCIFTADVGHCSTGECQKCTGD